MSDAMKKIQRLGQEMDAMSDGLTDAERDKETIRLLGERARPLCSATTAETPTMRERLARALASECFGNHISPGGNIHDYVHDCWPDYLDRVDAILRERARPLCSATTAETPTMRGIVYPADEDRKLLARVAQRQWGVPRTTPLDTINAIFTELRALGYTLTKD